MRLEVRLRPEAEEDLSDAAQWYEAQVAGLGHRFLDQVEHALSAIAEAPAMYPALHRGVRRALIRRFPFALYYRIEKTRIVVLAIMHASRDPRRWKSRM